MRRENYEIFMKNKELKLIAIEFTDGKTLN